MTSALVRYIKYWLQIFKHAGQIWVESNAFANAGSLAFFTLFSIAPVMIVIVSVIGIFYGQEAAQGQIAVQLQETIGAEAAETVQQAVTSSSLKEGGLLATIGGGAGYAGRCHDRIRADAELPEHHLDGCAKTVA